MPPSLARPCPCGHGPAYDGCCGPLLRGERTAGTAEELMRSRYTAHAEGDEDHLFRTWHPRTRPSVLRSPGTTWLELQVLAVSGGGVEDQEGTVEFEARFLAPEGAGVLHELSRFRRRAGRWVYLDGDLRH